MDWNVMLMFQLTVNGKNQQKTLYQGSAEKLKFR
jgi:hypothetical protein